MVVALAEAERSRRVDERAALRIEAAAEQRGAGPPSPSPARPRTPK